MLFLTEQEVQCASDDHDRLGDTVTDNGVQDNINHWVSSITDTRVEKKKKEKHKHNDVTGEEINDCNDDVSTTLCTDLPLKQSKKKSKSEERVDVDQIVMEDNEVMVVERKKKRKSKLITEESPNEKKAKIQTDDETEILPVKKHKKKRNNE